PTFRLSTTSRPRSGPGGKGGRAPCAAISTMCWRCCRSSRQPTTAAGGPLPPYEHNCAALLPLRPAAFQRLQGPPCSYVGHPLTEQLASLRPNTTEQARRDSEPPVLLVLPGSRRSEVRHHLAVFGAALGQLRGQGVTFELMLPTMPHLVD